MKNTLFTFIFFNSQNLKEQRICKQIDQDLFHQEHILTQTGDSSINCEICSHYASWVNIFKFMILSKKERGKSDSWKLSAWLYSKNHPFVIPN